MKYSNTWDLDAIFPGGTKSPQLREKLHGLTDQIGDYERMVTQWNVPEQATAGFVKTLLHKKETVENGLEQAGTFVQMWQDSFMDDPHANVVMGQVMDLTAKMENINVLLIKKLVSIPGRDWDALFADKELREVSFALNEIRMKGKRLLSEKEERIITELNKDGLTAWSRIYDTVVSIMTIPFTDKDGKTTEFSVGQAMNRMYADPDPAVRRQLFENWEKAWAKYAPIFADILNHLSGFRLTLQKLHQRKDFLEEPLEYNRMSKKTLDAMWTAVARNKQPFIDFLNEKAKIFGMEKLGWQDVEAPVAFGDYEPPRFTFDEACDFIIDSFASFGPKLASFAKHALENRWVEAEDRPNKRPGGYCAELPEFGESRIFTTFTGSSTDVSTLAHELGHAFHSYVMRDLPSLNRNYAMNVAETASTFAETIVSNAALKRARTKEEKLSLLNAKLENATAMFLNIHARYLFETSFYKERSKGIVSLGRLNELMLSAQKEAFGDCLSVYHPYFWCSKLHFFIDDIPFYNFPYTFGYLFSLGIYAEYLKNPVGFEERYMALLRDTGSMVVEDLAAKHLNIDLTKTDFWEEGIKLMKKDAEEFILLSRALQNR